MKSKAFTLIELLVAMAVSAILIGATSSVYSLFRTSMVRDQQSADYNQNARVAMDRMVREIRQTPDVVTAFPQNPSDTTVTQPHEIQFENGHQEDLTYLRYYLNGTSLKLDILEYYFNYDPTYRVRWNAIGNANAVPVSRVISTQDIADNVTDLTIYGNTTFSVQLTTGDGLNQSYMLRTAVTPRNF